jgi:MFS family permease
MIGAAGADGGINQTYFAPHLANDFQYTTVMVGIMLFAISLGGLVGPIFFGWLSDRGSRTMVLQTSLGLSAVATLWVAWLDPSGISSWLPASFREGVAIGDVGRLGMAELLMFLSLAIYSALTTSRGTLTQSIVADIASDEDRDAAFSLYSLLGFLSQPFWLLVTGLLMDHEGFGVAVSRVSLSYLAGMVLLMFVKDLHKPGETPVAATA